MGDRWRREMKREREGAGKYTDERDIGRNEKEGGGRKREEGERGRREIK